MPTTLQNARRMLKKAKFTIEQEYLTPNWNIPVLIMALFSSVVLKLDAFCVR